MLRINCIRMPKATRVTAVALEQSTENKRWCWQFVFDTVDGALLVTTRLFSPEVAQTHHIGVSTAGSPRQPNAGFADANDCSSCPVTISWTGGVSVAAAAHLEM